MNRREPPPEKEPSAAEPPKLKKPSRPTPEETTRGLNESFRAATIASEEGKKGRRKRHP